MWILFGDLPATVAVGQDYAGFQLHDSMSQSVTAGQHVQVYSGAALLGGHHVQLGAGPALETMVSAGRGRLRTPVHSAY